MKRLLFIGLGLACNLSALAQVLDRQDQVTTFSSRIQTPVEVEVTRTKEELTFTAKNKSPYPYELELEFNVFRNLSPSMSKHTAILHSGSNRLFKLRIEDPEASPDYSYSIRYKIANSRSDIDLSFPYLIPLKPKAVVEPHTWSNSDGSDYYAINSFKGSRGDTIYAVRRGIVTSVPSDIQNEKIGKGTFEVIHTDGTVALYKGLDQNSVFLKAGQKVYPGQPIGVFSDFSFVTVQVYKISDNGLASLPIYFATKDQEKLLYSSIKGVSVQHPLEVVQLELSNKEKTKLNKKTLYSSKD